MKNKQLYHSELFNKIVDLIEQSRLKAFYRVNEELVLLYYGVGEIVSKRVKNGEWGDKTVEDLSVFILNKYPDLKGFNRRGLYRMKLFYETYSVPEFMTTLLTQMPHSSSNKSIEKVLSQLQWSSHLHILSKTKTNEEKIYYLFKSITEKLSVRELERQLDSASFERAMLHDKKETTALTQLPNNIFKDPYIFEFLSLPEKFSEKDLEKALLLNLQKFILELGKGFTCMGSQYRIQVGNKDYYTDLLFYNRDLQCLVLFELKIEEFSPEALGKLNFYLEALDRDVKKTYENPSIGVLLCKGKDHEVVEYAMARTASQSLIADYETKLIPKNILENKLQQLVELYKYEKINESTH
jgi:predicted nuclease of restriction endonuclease-like (RecB) superfamily